MLFTTAKKFNLIRNSVDVFCWGGERTHLWRQLDRDAFFWRHLFSQAKRTPKAEPERTVIRVKTLIVLNRKSLIWEVDYSGDVRSPRSQRRISGFLSPSRKHWKAKHITCPSAVPSSLKTSASLLLWFPIDGQRTLVFVTQVFLPQLKRNQVLVHTGKNL